MLRIFLFFPLAAAMAQPAFEVASIKPAVLPPGSPEHAQYHMTESGDPSRVELTNASLLDLIRTAFGVSSYQISGPSWMANEKFDIVAKIPAGASREQTPEMLQRLLAGRFGLVTHRSQVERTVNALTMGRTGAKLTPTPPDSDAPAAGGFRRSVGADGSLQMEIRRMSASGLAELIGRFMGQSVADATSMKGSYDFTLTFSIEDLRSAAAAAGVAAPVGPGTAAEPGESTIAASLQRYGLKLESRKMPVDLIVVDRLEKTPSGN